VDLFAGAGGLSEGFTRAGFRVVLALDQDPIAMRTYWLNHPFVRDDRIRVEDIRSLGKGDFRKLTGRERVDVLIGAPPCQGFSHAGFRSKPLPTRYRVDADERNYLFEYMVEAALELKPRLFLMENVPGMQTARKGELSFLEAAARELETKGGFSTAVWKLNASAYGVPQDRLRLFLVASRTGQMPSKPEEEYRDLHKQCSDDDALPPVTFLEATFDLPALESNDGLAVQRRDPQNAIGDTRSRRYLQKFRIIGSSCLLYNHSVRYHNPQDLELYAMLKPGEDSVHALERYGRHDLMRYRTDAFDDKYARLRPDRPSKTIVSHLAKDGNGYIHPSQVRSISLREAARLQSFQDSYAFCGSPSDQWVQLGNAVPPVLAEAVARSFLRELKRS
jgi:DNA (cytosine-5)-methyltransferase 1